jgi:antitoxin ParD1/3/4
MHAQKLCISLPQKQYEFIKSYQAERHYKTQSKVIKDAIQLLQQAQLESCYREANQEIDSDFDITILDGIEKNETW